MIDTRRHQFADQEAGSPASRHFDEPVTIKDVQFLVKKLITQPSMLKAAANCGLSAALFSGPDEYAYSVVISAATGLVQYHNALTRDMLVVQIQSWISASAVTLSEDERLWLFGEDDNSGFLFDAFRSARELDATQEVAERDYTNKVLYKFLNTRYIAAAVENLFAGRPRDAAVSGMDSLLEQYYRRAQTIKHIGAEYDDENFMPEFGSEVSYSAVKPTPTGLPWIDSYIEGISPGDVIGLLGPTGGGKSNMMIDAAVRMAQYYAAHSLPKLSVYVCYEDGNYRMKPLFWSAATHIRRELFVEEDTLDWSKLSTSEMPNEFDRALPENQNGEFILGERERYTAAQRWMKTNFRFLDFSYNQSTGARGTGGVDEIVAAIRDLREKTGMELGFICIDYAGLMLERYLAQTGQLRGGGVDNLWLPLKMLPDRLRSEIAVPNAATVMLAHQIAGGEAMKKPFYRYLHHFDVQGCKALAENLHACVTVNKEDPDTQARLIHYSKIRYGVPARPTGIIKIKKEYCAIELVTDSYHVDEFSKKILPNNEFSNNPTPTASRRLIPPVDLPVGDSFGNFL